MLETSRLHILPLDVPALELYLQGNNLFELEQGLTLTNRNVHTDVKRYVNTITLPCMRRAPEDHFLFFTFWLVIEKKSRLVVAEMGFKGVPNPAGVVEIGYGTVEGARNKGFMTEAVAAIIHWSSKRQDISSVLAETAKTNTASIRVLQKNGFEQYDQKGDMLWWRTVFTQKSGFMPV
ncbi:GNAT family N-acetyltransferase [Pseudoflavitalea rhizosphaerae]|uniref:GNAT family N-acetyltransferase n=1 Tax=Pseudoflavitalea rhizosphaerae TaxID=1884793 RepID=UPI000F8F138B|nr:GNAT family N-acetyltransferase [Pseudoflavitalea rhizosphaerae]